LTPPVGPSTKTPDNKKKVEALQRACEDAFNKPEAASSCSHAVWYVIRALINPDEPFRKANQLIDHMTSAWTEVPLNAGWKLANQGVVVVGGKPGPSNGHVIVIYPGDKISSGGYNIQTTDKRTKKKITMKMPSHGDYPRCMSRSMGSWPGGTSNGTLTVFDPWGNDEVFATVKYWTMNKP
jgi:hypothetical protein